MTTITAPIIKAGASIDIEVPDELSILNDQQEIPQGHGVFRILTKEDGDKRVVWDNRSLAQIRDAQSMFKDMIKKGLVPYKVGLDGKTTAEVMDVFDPLAEEVIFLPAPMLAGG
jgi:hypothetical protein